MANQTHRLGELDVTSDQASSTEVLTTWVSDARTRTLQLVSDLDDEQLIGPKLPTINPLLWEIGHAAWFQDHWVLQHAGGLSPIQADGERLFDSIGIEHDVRWDLPLPPRDFIFDYVRKVRDAVLELLDQRPLTEELKYFVKLSVFHEDMHTEAYTYTRQTLGYRQPALDAEPSRDDGITNEANVRGDVEIAGGVIQLGAEPDSEFVFDNEKWAHPVSVEPFAISRTAVSQQEFAAFVDDDGYGRPDLWSEEGWQWRRQVDAKHPVYWRRDGDGWLRRHFDQWLRLEPNVAMIHVCWYEADAYCRWAKRRLPTETEWEFAAAANRAHADRDSPIGKLHYPWGKTPPKSRHANFDWQAMGPVDARAHSAGDSPSGCRQMLGNVWEWTATTFNPYPGFVTDPYKDYSVPCFGNCKVLRGGCWATRSRLIRNTWRNYYQPDRRDVLAGFRTCKLS